MTMRRPNHRTEPTPPAVVPPPLLARWIDLPALAWLATRSLGGPAVQIPALGYLCAALLWPADKAAAAAELPPVLPGDTYSRHVPADIDESGRIAGTYSFSREAVAHGVRWQPPYTAPTDVPNLRGLPEGGFNDISPTTNGGYSLVTIAIRIGRRR